MCLYNINQSNENGNNRIEILELEIDVEWLNNVIYNKKEKIRDILDKLKNKSYKEKESDEINIMKNIEDKNKKNELEIFYSNYIKKHENELDILYNFFKEEEMFEEIDEASETIKMAVFSIKKNEKLTPKIFNIVIQKHTESMNNIEDKQLMKIFIYFLYRHCFIGEV